MDTFPEGIFGSKVRLTIYLTETIVTHLLLVLVVAAVIRHRRLMERHQLLYLTTIFSLFIHWGTYNVQHRKFLLDYKLPLWRFSFALTMFSLLSVSVSNFLTVFRPVDIQRRWVFVILAIAPMIGSSVVIGILVPIRKYHKYLFLYTDLPVASFSLILGCFFNITAMVLLLNGPWFSRPGQKVLKQLGFDLLIFVCFASGPIYTHILLDVSMNDRNLFSTLIDVVLIFDTITRVTGCTLMMFARSSFCVFTNPPPLPGVVFSLLTSHPDEENAMENAELDKTPIVKSGFMRDQNRNADDKY